MPDRNKKLTVNAGAEHKTTHQLRQILKSGQFPDQSRLPPERSLAAEFGISRTILRKSLSVLEAEDLIWRHVGRGTFVGSQPKVEKSAQFVIADFTNPSEIMEVRLVFEPKIAAMAALRATPDDIDQMNKAHAKSLSAKDAVSFEVWDGALHQAVARSTGNRLLISFFEAINSLREDKIWGNLKEASLNRKRQNTYCRQHSDLVSAINDRNAVKAEQIMREHLEEVQRNLLGTI